MIVSKDLILLVILEVVFIFKDNRATIIKTLLSNSHDVYCKYIQYFSHFYITRLFLSFY